jgi:hypothetical protein
VGRALALPAATLADLCLAALVATRVAQGDSEPSGTLPGLRERARTWSGAEPSRLVEQSLQEARAGNPGDELAVAFRALMREES